MTSHLSSEQLDRVLAGRPSPEISRHIRKCSRCAQDVVATRELLGNFRTSATAAAEHYRQLRAARSVRRLPRMAWVLGTAVLLLSAAAPLAVHHRAANVTANRNGVAGAAPAGMSDDALLDNVQNDLSASVPASLLPLAGNSSNVANSTTEKRKN